MPTGGGDSLSPIFGPKRTYYPWHISNPNFAPKEPWMRTHESEEEHAKRLHHPAPHERPPAAQRVCEEEDEYQTRDDLDDAIDALGEEGSSRAREA